MDMGLRRRYTLDDVRDCWPLVFISLSGVKSEGSRIYTYLTRMRTFEECPGVYDIIATVIASNIGVTNTGRHRRRLQGALPSSAATPNMPRVRILTLRQLSLFLIYISQPSLVKMSAKGDRLSNTFPIYESMAHSQ